MKDTITIITDPGCWLESAAADQLKKTAELRGFVRAVGLPNLHPGRTPVGAVIETEGRIYPHLVGNDIGCGMTLFRTGIAEKQFKASKWIKRLEKLELSQDSGTLGGGNHFAEFLVPERFTEPRDKGEQTVRALEKGEICLLVHCGSRNLGQRIYEEFADPAGLASGTGAFAQYMEAHDGALRFAAENRLAVARTLLDQLGFQQEPGPVIDCRHNFVEQREGDRICFETFRSSGNGGQNVNKVETGVRAVYTPTGDSAVSVDERSQYRNKQIALERVRRLVEEQNREKAAAAVSDNWRQHTRLERGNAVKVYRGNGFRPRP